jgi:hypothetical protein
VSRGGQFPVRGGLPGPRPGVVRAGGLSIHGLAATGAPVHGASAAEDGVVEEARLGGAATVAAPVLPGGHRKQ